jgi:anaerobic selenocysteine-containing dehydrogenase
MKLFKRSASDAAASAGNANRSAGSGIEQRVFGLEEIRKEVARWVPAQVERVTGTPEEPVKLAARIMAEHRPGTFIWCMGGTNVFRGHDNAQGATDVGPNAGKPARLLRADRGRLAALGQGLGHRLRLAGGPLRPGRI